MECDSTISFDTKSTDKAQYVAQAFKAFESTSLSSMTDLDTRKESSTIALKKSGVALEAEDIYKHLVELDTGITEVTINGSKVSLGIFPIDFPESFCDFIFPILNDCGFENISCESNSEYGDQTLKYKNGKIVKTEDMFEM